jgi:hypothetical protein
LATSALPLSKGPPPRIASRAKGLKVPMPEPFRLHIEACTKRAPSATSPKFQPSPMSCTGRPAAALTAVCSRSIAVRGWWPMMSKRKLLMR